MNYNKGHVLKWLIRFIRVNLEALIWLAALILLAFHDPTASHYSLCPLNNLGFEFCPGCGLGHSISYLFRGEIIQSLEAHPLGIFAVVLLSYRIVSLFRKNYSIQNNFKTLKDG
jgi:hypothetical protein